MRTSPRRWAATSRPRWSRGRALPGTRAFNYHLLTPPIVGGFYPNVEFDYGNDSGRDCPLGIDCTNLRVAASGKSITTNLAIVGNETAANGYSTLWGCA